MTLARYGALEIVGVIIIITVVDTQTDRQTTRTQSWTR